MTWAGRYTSDELALGYDVGKRRQDHNIDRGRPGGDGLRVDYPTGLGLNVLGALGEIAARDVWGLDWDPVWEELDPARPDIGNLHIKATLLDCGRLRIRPDAPDEAPFVLVVLCPPRGYRIAGWIRGHRGKAEWHWFTNWGKSGRPKSYWVPQGVLCPPWTCPVEAAP